MIIHYVSTVGYLTRLMVSVHAMILTLAPWTTLGPNTFEWCCRQTRALTLRIIQRMLQAEMCCEGVDEKSCWLIRILR